MAPDRSTRRSDARARRTRRTRERASLRIDVGIALSSLLVVVASASLAIVTLLLWSPYRIAASPATLHTILAVAIGTGLTAIVANVATSLARVRNRKLEGENVILRHQVDTDGLTALKSRRRFDIEYEAAWGRACAYGGAVCLVLIDVDHFKPFNDTYGHPEGDKALRALGRAIADAVRNTPATAFRYGGEEFAILLADGDEASAAGIAADTRDRIRALAWPHSGGHAGILTASLGVACLAAAAHSRPEELMEAADRALYRAKQGGRGQVRVTLDARQSHLGAVDRAVMIDGIDVLTGSGEVVTIDKRMSVDALRLVIADIEKGNEQREAS